jgi:phosphate transport system protein
MMWTVTSTDVGERVRELSLAVVRLAALTVDAVVAGTDALVDGDLPGAQRVIDDDDAVDTQRHSVEDECYSLLATASLGTVDVRFVTSTLRVAHELERSADLMVNVAKTAWRLGARPLDGPSRRLVDRMGRQAVVQLRVAVNAFVDRDRSCASALADMDEAMDDLEQTLFHHLLECSAPDDDSRIAHAVQLGLVARHFERVGDHAVTIAQQVPFVVSGTRPTRRRRRSGASRFLIPS